MELSLYDITSFLMEKGEKAFFLNSGKDSFVAGKDYWVLVKEDKDMSPGSYIYTLKNDQWLWKFVPEEEGKKRAQEIREKTILSFRPELYFEADFERDKQGNIIIIRTPRIYSTMVPNYNIPLRYRLVIPRTGQVETVSFQTFDFFYRKYCEPIFYMQNSKEHNPIIFFKESPCVLISPVSWRQDGSFIYPEEGYLPIFNS